MRRSHLHVFLLLALAGNSATLGREQRPASAAASLANPTYDAVSLAAELYRIAAILEKKPSTNEMNVLRDSLPKSWTVTSQDSTYSISSEPLRNQLTPLSSDKAQVWVKHLAEQVESSKELAAGSPQARAQLERILARQGFAFVRPPSAWELFRQRLSIWIEQMLLRLFGSVVRHPLGGEILFWVLLAVAVGVIAMWVFRFFASRDRMNALAANSSVIAVRTWQEWIRAAREAANRGDFREAVHSAYWAGIVRLEDAGVVPKDRTKTPREYLRLVVEPAPGELAPSPTHREPLKALTKGLERVWYANRGAGPDDFRESLRHLEALGCSLE